MSKKKRKTNKHSLKKTPANKAAFKFNRRSLVKLGLFSALAVPAYVAISAFNKSHEMKRDLGVIGKGSPTLIQVHDESCPNCRQLLSSVKAVIGEFPDVQFKIADLNSAKGIKFASKHQAHKVTLVFFDSKGKKVDMVSGLQTEDEVRSFVSRVNRS